MSIQGGDEKVVELKDKGMNNLIKALKENLPTARVGILSGKNARTGAANSNATIGAKHEFGNEGMPIRSFLRMPITDELQKYLEQAGAFDKPTLDAVIKSGSIEKWMEKIGISAVAVVLEAFNTGGFGKWKSSNMALKETKQTLVETQQLKDSISYEVK